MGESVQEYQIKITENDNLYWYAVELNTDSKNFSVNVKLLAECIAEIENTKKIIKTLYDEIHSSPIGLTLGVRAV